MMLKLLNILTVKIKSHISLTSFSPSTPFQRYLCKILIVLYHQNPPYMLEGWIHFSHSLYIGRPGNEILGSDEKTLQLPGKTQNFHIQFCPLTVAIGRKEN